MAVGSIPNYSSERFFGLLIDDYNDLSTDFILIPFLLSSWEWVENPILIGFGLPIGFTIEELIGVGFSGADLSGTNGNGFGLVDPKCYSSLEWYSSKKSGLLVVDNAFFLFPIYIISSENYLSKLSSEDYITSDLALEIPTFLDFSGFFFLFSSNFALF